MFRTIIVALSALIFSFVHISAADDGDLIASLEGSMGYGLELLYNDANADLLLLFTTSGKVDGDWQTTFTVYYLEPDSAGGYTTTNDRTLLTVNSRVYQVSWAYDPKSKRFLIALLDGEINSATNKVKLLQLDQKGKPVGEVRTFNRGEILFNYPNLAGIPPKATNAPADARYLLTGFGQNPADGWTYGIASVFLDSNGEKIGNLKFSYNEDSGKNLGRFLPLAMTISGDKKGYLLACHHSGVGSGYKPSVMRLNGAGVFEKAVVVGDELMNNNSLAIFPVSKRKAAVSWVDDDSRNFWAAILPANLNSSGNPKMISEEPMCSGPSEFPYAAFCKPDGAKKTSVFFVGAMSNTYVYSTLMKKNGKTKSSNEVTAWSGIDDRMNYIYDRRFCVAPILGTSDMYCVVACGFGDMELRGFVIPGK